MKSIMIAVFLPLLLLLTNMSKGYTTSNGVKAAADSIANPNFDAALAEKLGADDYGMKSYFLVILKTGVNTSDDAKLRNESFRGHMENIQRLVSQDKLLIAGPLGRNENNYRGIFIFHNVVDEDEMNDLLQSDPAIANGYLGYDIYSWYGSAALPEYLPVSDRIWKLQP